MSNFKFELPFKVERSCRCSYVVSFTEGENKGTVAFISNENFFRLMYNPNLPVELIPRRNPRTGKELTWIMVPTMEWTFGFKARLFGLDGNRI